MKVIREIQKSGTTCSIINLGGFLKLACFQAASNEISYKCTHSDMFYKRYNNQVAGKLVGISKICENDPYVYQACGFGTATTNNEVLCGGYLCPTKTHEIHKYIDCDNDDCKIASRASCASENYTDISICDDKCDSPNCEDESNCNGYKYGVICKYSRAFVPVYMICNNDFNCNGYGKEDEQHCDVNSPGTTTCLSYRGSHGTSDHFTIPIHNYTRCMVFDVYRNEDPYCKDYIDQTNCTDIKRVGGYCPIGGHMSSVSKFALCGDSRKTPDEIKLCDNGFENLCVFTSTNCQVHKHRMCNKEYDCLDKSDEFDEICQSTTVDFNCERLFYPHHSGNLPLSWITDGVHDCRNGEDENQGVWQFCGNHSEKTRRVKLSSEIECTNVYLCPGYKKSYVPLNSLCDGVESCGMENEVCSIARDFPRIKTTALRNGTTLDLCSSSPVFWNISCSLSELNRLPGDTEIFGASKQEIINHVYIPNSKVKCSLLSGEYYIYLSCLDLCIEADVTCLLSDDQRLLHDSCPGQFSDRVYTLANNSFLTFVQELERGKFYHQNYFQCKNGKCIEFKEVCNLVDDCGDQSDEIDCKNHMVCRNTLNETKKHMISIQQRCDGIYDCFDLSDECNKYCKPKEILGNWYLKGFCWFMGLSAVLLNTVTVVRGIISIRCCRSGGMLITQVLVILIGSGDILIGAYLIILSVYDSIVYGKDFCHHQIEWLTGTACAALGVISTFGSQISLFSMTLLGMIRVYGLVFNQLKAPSPVDKGAVIRAIFSLIGVTLVAFLIAVVPLLPSLEDYFVQGIYYDPEYRLFIGFPNKIRHVEVLETYFNLSSHQSQSYPSSSITTDTSWNDIEKYVDSMFSNQYGRARRTTVHFYGNDGVCLFKYFMRSDDARRSRQDIVGTSKITDVKGDIIVWLMLSTNFVCFVCIFISYMFINITATKSSRLSASDKNAAVKRKQKDLQNKITVIVATDFLCWIPFIIISALHNWKVIDATFWYDSFAMTVIPLNSVINPLIYDHRLKQAVMSKIRMLALSARNNVKCILQLDRRGAETKASSQAEVALDNVGHNNINVKHIGKKNLETNRTFSVEQTQISSVDESNLTTAL